MRQQRHTDFPEFNMTLNAPEKLNSTIVALCDNTQLHFYVGQDKQLVTVDMKKSGDCCFFAGDVLRAEWQGQEPNFRLFMYWPTTDIYVCMYVCIYIYISCGFCQQEGQGQTQENTL